jgi:hypothetical protein
MPRMNAVRGREYATKDEALVALAAEAAQL